MLSDSSLTVLAIVALVLFGLAVVLMIAYTLSEVRKRVRAHVQVHRVGSQVMIGSGLTARFEIGDPGAVDGFITELVKAGRTDEAVQVFQFTKHVGTVEATTAIDAIARERENVELAPTSRPMPM